MSNFGHVERITVWTEKGEITFRSKLEYRWYVWCQLRKDQGLIKDWWYEDQESCLELEQEYMKNKKMYLPDFTILTNNDEYHYEETKGWFTSKDYTKMLLACQQYENQLSLIFASLIPNSKNAKTRAQRERAERLQPHLEEKGGRVIYDAAKTIHEPIKHLFEF